MFDVFKHLNHKTHQHYLLDIVPAKNLQRFNCFCEKGCQFNLRTAKIYFYTIFELRISFTRPIHIAWFEIKDFTKLI